MKKEKKDFYKSKKEMCWDFSKINLERVDNSEFRYAEIVSSLCSLESNVLDIGTGGGEWLFKHLPPVNSVVAIDLEPGMIQTAIKNLTQYPEKQGTFFFSILNGDGKLPYKDSSFDLVISRHCGANMKEVKRVLKNGCYFVSEDVDTKDCQELKDVFKRGQGYFEQQLLSERFLNEFLKVGFLEVKQFKIEQTEYFKTPEDLLYLLRNTPIIDNFGEVKGDLSKFNEYVKSHTTPKGIVLNRRLFGMLVKK